MKEAAGEANLTVVAIILIAVVVAVATPLINSLMHTSANKSCCTDAGGVWKSNSCQAPSGDMGHYDSAAYSTCVSSATA
jgi:hypothetical protein